LPLTDYNLQCVRRDRGRIDATRIADRARSPASTLPARKLEASIASGSRIRRDASREPRGFLSLVVLLEKGAKYG